MIVTECDIKVMGTGTSIWHHNLQKPYAKKNKAVEINTVITEFYIAQLHSSESSVVRSSSSRLVSKSSRKLTFSYYC